MYIQIIKNLTFWTFSASFDRRSSKNKITSNLNHYQDSQISEYHIQEIIYEDPQIFTNIINHPDFRFFTRNLNKNELDIVKMLIEGYTFKEIIKKYNNKVLHLVLNKLINNQVERYRTIKSLKQKSINNLEFLKSKIQAINFKEVFSNRKHELDNHKIKLYSMYLQGINISLIAKKLGKSKSQINVEIYRIKNKLNNDNSK